MSASAAPYGYTITIWSSGAVSMDLLGKPHLAAALLYLTGAVTAFLAVEAIAYGSVWVRHVPPPAGRIAALGHAHFLSAASSVIAVWASDHALKRELSGWLAAGFIATALYLTLNAVQVTLASEPDASAAVE